LRRVLSSRRMPLQKRHQRVDLAAGSFPVLHRKGVQREDVAPCGRLTTSDRVDAGTVPFDCAGA
jgi:hypothetical protein